MVALGATGFMGAGLGIRLPVALRASFALGSARLCVMSMGMGVVVMRVVHGIILPFVNK